MVINITSAAAIAGAVVVGNIASNIVLRTAYGVENKIKSKKQAKAVQQ